MLSLIEPNIHPILVHFAYALSITATGLYVLGKIPFAARRLPMLRQSADLLLTLAALSAIVTVAAGLQAYYSVEHDGPSHAAMTVHRNWAFGSTLFLLVVALWRWVKRQAEPSVGFVAATVVTALLLTITAWWGGHIVYGYGIGVTQLPEVSGPGHDHHGGGDDPDHGEPSGHDEGMTEPEIEKEAGEMSGKPQGEPEQGAHSDDHTAPHAH